MSGLRPGVKVSDHLELISLLGQGAMGSVWLGRDHKLERDVAIKVILDDPSDPRSQQRFEREAKVAARLDHPHVVRVFDFGWFEELPYIVMERLDGEPLDERLHRDGRLLVEDADRLVTQLGRALRAMHTDGVVHRDIKPANLFLLGKVDELFVKIIDFGIARPRVPDGTGMTSTGALVGTPSYMSPEQLFDGARATAASDLWALAVVAYEVCTGRLPFAAENVVSLGKLLSSGTFDPPSSIHSELPRELDAFFVRALSIEPEARFADADAFLQDWSQAIRAEPSGESTNASVPDAPPSATAVTERRELGEVGRYRLLLALGQGGMAEVFLAVAADEVTRADDVVVLKRPQDHDDAQVRSMFLDEARIAARIEHPNVVKTREAGEVDGVPFLVMEYLEGQPLRRWLDAPLPEALQVHIAVEVLRGLHHAHETKDFDDSALGVIHRDVSPHNVMITYDGEVKLLDFGIAKAARRLTETRRGTVKGKTTYMSPEQARGDEVDRRTDVFAVAVMLWEMRHGRRFWEGASTREIEQRLRHDELPEMDEPSDALERICRRGFSADPDDRFATAADMAEALQAVANELDAPEGESPRQALAALAKTRFATERQRMDGELERILVQVLAEAEDDESVEPANETLVTKTELAAPAHSPEPTVTRTQTMSSAPPSAEPRRSWGLPAAIAALAIGGVAFYASRDPEPTAPSPDEIPSATAPPATTSAEPVPPPAPDTQPTAGPAATTPEPSPPPATGPRVAPAPKAEPTGRAFDDRDPWEREATPTSSSTPSR